MDRGISQKQLTIVVPSLKAGGLERVASIVANNFVERGFEIKIVCLSRSVIHYPLHDKVQLIMPSEEISCKKKLLRVISLFFWLRKQLLKTGHKTILSFGEGYNAFVIASLSGQKKDIFVSNRASPLSSLKGIRRKINPFFYKYAKAVLVQTQKSIDLLQPVYKNSIFKVIHNPFLLPAGHDDVNRQNIILNVGSIGGKKNQDWLIRYFSKIENIEGWKLCLVGDGPQRKYCEQVAKEFGVETNVIFTGTQKNVEQYYKQAKIFAFTSTSEGFPNALGEAMSHGMAPISFDCITGPAELINNGVNGYLVENGNDKEYIEKLNILTKTSALQAEFGSNARKKMEQFEVNHIIDDYIKILFS